MEIELLTLALTSLFVISHTAFGKYCENIRSLHNTIYSFGFTYSAAIDFRTYLFPDPFKTHVCIIEYVCVSHMIYMLFCHWHELPRYELVGFVVNIGINYYFRESLPILVIAYNYLHHGHLYVIMHSLKYAIENRRLGAYKYKKYTSALYGWIIMPYAMMIYSLIIWKLIFDNTIGYGSMALILGHVAYFVGESYVAAIDLGYNKALMRISEDKAAEAI